MQGKAGSGVATLLFWVCTRSIHSIYTARIHDGAAETFFLGGCKNTRKFKKNPFLTSIDVETFFQRLDTFFIFLFLHYFIIGPRAPQWALSRTFLTSNLVFFFDFLIFTLIAYTGHGL